MNNFGYFSNVLAVVSILSKLVDFGIEPIIFREFSKNIKNFAVFNTGLTLRFSIYILLLIGFNITAPLLNITFNDIILYNVLFTTILISMKMLNVRELLSTPFKATLKMHYPMTLSIIDNLLLLCLILFIPLIKDKIFFFTLFYAASNLPGFILMFYILYKKFGYKFKINFDKGLWIAKESFPLFGLVVLNILYMQIDIIILNNFSSYYDVGIYSAAIRLTMPLNIIPQAIVTTVFPILVKKLSDKIDTSSLTNMVIKMLFVISFLLFIIFCFKSESLILLLFGNDYKSAALPAIILYCSQIFIFFTYYSQAILIADYRQKFNFLYGLILVVINLIICFLLIPHYSFIGAAVAKLAASFASFIFVLVVLKKLGFLPSIGRYRVLLWSLIIGLVFYAVSIFPLPFYLILTPFIIVILTAVIKLFSRDEMNILFKLINSEKFGQKILSKIYGSSDVD